MKRDLVDELYKTAYKRYREKYPNKNFVSIPNFLDSLWYRIEGELNRNGYNAAKKYVEEAELIVVNYSATSYRASCFNHRCLAIRNVLPSLTQCPQALGWASS